VGYTTDDRAVKWTKSDGFSFLPTPPHGESHATAISRDGNVIAGSVYDPSVPNIEAVRWIADRAPVALAALANHSSQAEGMSDNGAVIVGYQVTNGVGEPFRWTKSSGMVGLGLLTGAIQGEAYDVSNDGVVVGANGGQAFRWTETGGMVGLGFLPGDNYSYAIAVSNDGSIVTGVSSLLPAGGSQPFIWSEQTGLVGLGNVPDRESSPAGMTADGSMIVGFAGFPPDSNEIGGGFIWTRSDGMRLFADVVSDLGLGSEEFLTMMTPTAISPGGRYIVGTGLSNDWLFDRGFTPVPEPSTYGVVSALFLAAIAFRRRVGKRRKKALHVTIEAGSARVVAGANAAL
jgi:hypothetical protein